MAVIDIGGQSLANVDEINGTPVAELGGGGAAEYPFGGTDGDTFLHWKCNEASGTTVANSGTASSANLADLNTQVHTSKGVVGGLTSLAYGASAANPATSNVTVSAWLRVHVLPAASQTLFAKSYHTATWSSPHAAFNLSTTNAAVPYAQMSVSGVMYTYNFTKAYAVGQWFHCGFSYDGANVRTYINGELDTTTARTGSIDYGESGPWSVNGVYTSGENYPAKSSSFDVRVDNVVRDAAWFLARFAEGGPPASVGDGDVVGPASAVDQRIAVFDGTTGKIIADSGIDIGDVGGNAGPRIYPADADDYLVWELQEAAGATTIVNTGTATSGDLAIYNTGITLDAGGPFGRAASFPHTGDTGDGRTFYGAPTKNPSTTTMTLSCWVKIHTVSGHGVLCGKAIQASGWSDPYVSLDLYHYTDGSLRASCSISGTGRVITADTDDSIMRVTDGWCHVGVTYDGTTVKLYKNGHLVGSGAYAGTLDHNTAGNWFIGSVYTSDTHNHGFGGLIRGVRVANVTRAQAWFKSVYAYGIGEAA